MRRFSADTSGAASIYAIGSRFISGGLFRQQNSSPPSGPYREPTLSGLEARGRRNVFSYCLKRLVLFLMIGDFLEWGKTCCLSPVSPVSWGSPPHPPDFQQESKSTRIPDNEHATTTTT